MKNNDFSESQAPIIVPIPILPIPVPPVMKHPKQPAPAMQQPPKPPVPPIVPLPICVMIPQASPMPKKPEGGEPCAFWKNADGKDKVPMNMMKTLGAMFNQCRKDEFFED